MDSYFTSRIWMNVENLASCNILCSQPNFTSSMKKITLVPDEKFCRL
jgi:hypothetical protein